MDRAELIEAIVRKAKSLKPIGFNVKKELTLAFNKRLHLTAIMYALEQVEKYTPKNPNSYFSAIAQRESGNLYEREHTTSLKEITTEQAGEILARVMRNE